MNPLYNDIRYNSKIRYTCTSIWSAQKSAGRACFHCCSHVILQENICFVYLLESPQRGDSKIYIKRIFVYLLESPQRGDSIKYTKRMIHKNLFKSIRYSCFRRVHIKFLFNSKFDFTAKLLVTNSVVITRVLSIFILTALKLKRILHSSRGQIFSDLQLLFRTTIPFQNGYMYYF